MHVAARLCAPLTSRVSPAPLWAIAIATLLAGLSACDKEPAREASAGGASGAASAPHAPRSARAAAATGAKAALADAPANAVQAPAAVTIGDALPPLPRPAPRLFGGGESAPTLPDISCEDLAPDAQHKLARRYEILLPPKGDAVAPRTLEVCQFNRWLTRGDTELAGRTGRTHHFVAAFPGSTVSSWTSKELKRADADLPEEGGTGLAAGWGGLIPTGIAERPAVAVVSGRFFDGAQGEMVHYIRSARVLELKAGRWTWVPLVSRAFATLDEAHLAAACNDTPTEGPCAGAGARIVAWGAAKRARATRREARLNGKPDPGGRTARKARGPDYEHDADPQAAWLRDGFSHAKRKRLDKAIAAALKAQALCGEPLKDAWELTREALAKVDRKPVKITPAPKRAALCEPLPDKPAPKDRKR